MSKEISVLVMSCDKYQDTFKPFFKLYNKYFNKYKTYIGTETIDCEYATTLKSQGSWTKRVRENLEKIDTDYVLFLLDDFFIRKEVDTTVIDALKYQFKDDIACFNLEVNKVSKIEESSSNRFKLRSNNQAYLCSCQPTLWNRKILIELLQKDLSPWEWETQILDSKYKFYINTQDLIIDIGWYDFNTAWGIAQGKWAIEMIDLNKKEKLNIDFTKRGFYDKKLSIITPYYKTLDYTKKLSQILEPQLTNEVEWIIVDDGCYEKELDKLNAIVIHKKNGGVSSARNRALNIASGKYVAFIDSDDLVVNNYVNIILNKIKEDFDYCFMSWEYFNKREGQVIITDYPPQDNTSVWNCIYKRETIGNKRFDEDTQYGEEVDFNNKVRNGVKANITQVMYLYNFDREDSATELYRLGQLSKYKPIKAQIVMFLRFVSKIGGVEDFLYEFFKENHKKHDIIFLYDEADPYQLRRYQEFVKCRFYRGEKVDCDTYINVNVPKTISYNVNAKEYLEMAHTDYGAMQWNFIHDEKSTTTIAVSEVVKEALLKQIPSLNIVVIPNLLNLDEIEYVENPFKTKGIKIVSATRLSWEKGYDRMKIFAKRLNELKIEFEWLVFTNDVPNEEIPNFTFMKPCYNVMDYVKYADYYFVGSNTEADSMSNKKALYIGLPIISTDYPSIYEQGFINNENGYILNMDMSNMDEIIKKMKNIPKFNPIRPNNAIKWIPYLGEETISNYEFSGNPIQSNIEDRWVSTYESVRDETGKLCNIGEECILHSSERIRTLLDHNFIKRMEE